MSLVYYGTLVAEPSGVATVRFSTPVVLQTMRIIPTGIPAFKNVENCVGETTPPQFALKIYSNALMLPTDAEPKPKASNTLLSTQLDYVDEMLDWDFAVSPPASSRLMIFQGSFKKLTIAIYGDSSIEKAPPEIEEDTATQFISLVNESLGENPDLQTCKLLFEILGYASLQSDSLVTAVLYGISTVTYLADPRLLEDDDVPKHIERWISHPLVARYLNEPDIQEYMVAGLRGRAIYEGIVSASRVP
ncbi:hypothetical protein RHS01_01970 [Rhizoctonia solani]|uniref:Virilizer N-terminal domain-containing protein n=1 Tax=Rhizoctonia solani TaxID=456999 RepID=A0A8H7IMM5_9AGAM|nr:hypothetical protein RHS01_01970 [Rhizoctonia solani]